MTSGSGSQRDFVLPRWIYPFHRYWKPLAWIWGGLLFGIFINVSSSWLTNKNFDVSGTPLGWGVKHLWITLPPLFLLVLLTLLAGLASLQEHVVSPASPLTLTTKQRLQFIRGFQQEYTSRLASSLQGQVALELHLRERTDVIVSSASLVFHHLETGEVSPLPLGTSIIQVYDRVQRGLLLLGAPGSGKTTLLLELALELLQRAENDPDQPLAIIFNLSSWARTQLPLAQWLVEQCSLVYGIPKHLSAAWIAQEQVQFLLDGLDEVGASARNNCIQAINTYRQAHLVPLVVCSRSQEYESQPARLILPGAVEIQPLEPAQVSQVLKQAGRSLTAVRAALHSNATLNDLLTTPLMLNVVILTYRDKAAKELPQSGSPKEQQREIFGQYIQHMLQRYQQHRTFSLEKTTCSLVWLAQQMQQRHLTEFHLESLQADWLTTRRTQVIYRLVFGLVVGLTGGLVVGLVGRLVFALAVRLAFGPVFGLVGRPVFGLGGGLGGGLIGGLSGIFLTKNVRLKLNQKIHTSGWNALYLGLLFFLCFGLIGGLVGWLVGGLFSGLISGLTFGLISGLISGLVLGLTDIQPAEKFAWSWEESRKGLVVGLVGGLTVGLIFGLVFGPVFGLVGRLVGRLVFGLVFGMIGVLVGGLIRGLSGVSLAKNVRLKPNQGIHTSGWNALRLGLLFFLCFGLVVGLVGGLILDLVGGLVVGLVVGLIGGLVVGLVGGGGAYFQHYVLRLFLAQSHALPWRAVLFLEEETGCILLQRVGGGYRFIHPLLQEHFASLNPSSAQTSGFSKAEK